MPRVASPPVAAGSSVASDLAHAIASQAASAAAAPAVAAPAAAAPLAAAPAVSAPSAAAPVANAPSVSSQAASVQTASAAAPCVDAAPCTYWKTKFGSTKFACSEINNRRDRCPVSCNRCGALGLSAGAVQSLEQQSRISSGAYACNFVVGDAVGGYEQYIGNYDADWECASAVMDMHSTANGATYMANSSLCYAVFGMAASNGISEMTTCKFDGRTPLLKDVPAAKRMAAGAASAAALSGVM